MESTAKFAYTQKKIFKICEAKPVYCVQANAHFNCHTKHPQILRDKWRLLLKLQEWSAKKSVHISCPFCCLLCLYCFLSQGFSLESSWEQAGQILGKLSRCTSSIPAKRRGWSLDQAAVQEVLRASCTFISPPGYRTAGVLVLILDLCRGHWTAGEASSGSSTLLWTLMSFSRCWVSWGLFTSSCWGAGTLPGTQQHFHIQSSMLVMLAAEGLGKAGSCQVTCVLLGIGRRISVSKAACAFSSPGNCTEVVFHGPITSVCLSTVTGPTREMCLVLWICQTGLGRALW